MNEAIRHALGHDRVIDITTTGRKTGEARRIEIWFHNVDGRLYITGMPGKRGWYANLLSNPQFVFHLKDSAVADLPAIARPVTDPVERRSVLERLLERLGHLDRIDAWMARSPLVEVEFA